MSEQTSGETETGTMVSGLVLMSEQTSGETETGTMVSGLVTEVSSMSFYTI